MRRLEFLPLAVAGVTVAAIAVDQFLRTRVSATPYTPRGFPRIQKDSLPVGGQAPAPNWLRIAVILLVLGAALFVILSKKYDDADRKWAYGAVGAILGYVIGAAA